MYKRQVQGRRDKNAGSKWTEDRKKRHSEKMKNIGKKKRTKTKELNWHVVLRWPIRYKKKTIIERA